MKALLILLLLPAVAWSQPQWNLMPMPSSVSGGEGELVIGGGFTVAVHGDPRLQRAATRFLAQLSRQTGIPIPNQLQKGDTATLVVSADHAAQDIQQLGEDESYSLTVTPQGARISAPTTLGAMYGLQTFLQLVQTSPAGFAAPGVTIQDRPRFPWRGLLLDVCRHWMPVEVVERTLDGMAAAKLNVLHWHLSEDQAVRVESKKLPKLQELASGGHFYTQAEIKDVVAYAHDRGIRVVPEFDMPGHTTAWLAAYPELASGPGPYRMEQGFDTRGVMDPTRDSTYKFLNKFIAEMSKLFPDAFWHSGGDEVNFKEWESNPKIQEFKRAHKFADDEALQAFFTGRLIDILKKRGKRMVGWDEVFDPELPKTMVVQSWRGPKSLAETARAGYGSILSNGYYLDLAHHAADYYAVDPLGGDAASLGPAEQAHILGGEACMWAEIVSPETVDSRIWPSAAAVAEKLWSPATVNDAASMYRRLDRFSGELEFLGVTADANYWPMLRRLAGDGDAAALRTLADVVEPIKDYRRHNSRSYTINTPLNRLPDAARTESQTARNFALMVDHLLAGQASPVEKAAIRRWLEIWRDNDALLAPTLRNSSPLQEDAGLSQTLSQVAQIGLQALDARDGHSQLDASAHPQQLAALDQAAKPQAELQLMIVEPVRKLVQASAY